MTPLRRRLIDDLKIRNYAYKTIKSYVAAVRMFAEYFGKSPDLLGVEEVRQYQLYLRDQRKVSASYLNVVVCALRFFYTNTLGRPQITAKIKYARRPKRLPIVLSGDEILRIFDVVQSHTMRVLLMTTYSAGLRVSEAVRLKLSDVDSGRGVLHIRQGKGRKDRLVPLSPVLREVLQSYWRVARPDDWLFPGMRPGCHLSGRTAQRALQRAVRELGILKRVTMHSLRHSFATHSLEAGVSLLVIQKLLGHKRLETTTIYTHVSQQMLDAAPTPLDRLAESLGDRSRITNVGIEKRGDE